MTEHDLDTCTRAERPAETAAAAIAEIARRHGLDVRPHEVLARAALPERALDLFSMLLAARRCGFDVVPLEGGFDELPEVPRPNIVLFHGAGERPEFVVLLDIDGDSARIGDPLSGAVRRLSRAEFTARWTGDAVQLLPDEAGFAAFRRELLTMRDPWQRLGRRLGLVPLTGRKLLFAALALLTGLVAALPAPPSDPALALRCALALAAVLSLWLTLFAATCRSCSGAAALVGALPLAPAGLAVYGGLLVAALILPAELAPLLPFVLAAAAGAHASLVPQLLRSTHRCVPCLTIAAAVLAALVLAHSQHPTPWPVIAALSAASFAATAAVTRFARRHFELELRDGGIHLAQETLAEPTRLGFGQVRLVVYKQPGCPACIHYEMTARPLLLQEFGDALVLDERRPAPGAKVSLPLFVVQGAADLVVDGFAGDQLYDRLRAAVTAAFAPGARDLRPTGALCLVRPA